MDEQIRRLYDLLVDLKESDTQYPGYHFYLLHDSATSQSWFQVYHANGHCFKVAEVGKYSQKTYTFDCNFEGWEPITADEAYNLIKPQ